MTSRKSLASIAAAIAVTSAAAPGAAQTITRGPYLQWVAADSVYVVWDQDAPSTPEVRYGPNHSLSATSTTNGTHHEVKLTGLAPNSDHSYAVYQGAAKLSSDLTLPSAVSGKTPFAFAVVGDTRTDHVSHQQLVYSLALEKDVRFLINTGDLVSSGEVAADWVKFFEVEYPLISHVPLFPLIGNHDEKDGDATLYYNAFVMKSGSPQPEAYYSFDYGNAHFVVLDSHVNVDPWYICILAGKLYDGCFRADQLSWLEQDLKAASANPAIDHIIVMIHIGPYSSKEGRTGNAQMRELLPLFKTHGVTMIVSGHDHYYERGVAGNGIPYVISGGGGAPLYSVGGPSLDPHTVIFNKSIHHYNIFRVNGTAIEVQVKDADGNQLDQYALGQPNPPLPDAGPPQDSGPSQPDAGPPADSAPAPDQASSPDTVAPTPDSGGGGGGSDDGGCSVAGGRMNALPLPALTLLLFSLARRRRR